MDMKRIVIGTIVGAVTLHIVGYVLFDVTTLGTYYAANVGPATGTLRDVPLQWAIGVGNLALAGLLTVWIASRGSAQTTGGGFATGAVIGFLVWFQADFVLFGYTNLWNLQVTIVDPFLSSIPSGVAGAVIAAVLPRVPKSAAA